MNIYHIHVWIGCVYITFAYAIRFLGCILQNGCDDGYPAIYANYVCMLALCCGNAAAAAINWKTQWLLDINHTYNID